jgi:hypothetical protein
MHHRTSFRLAVPRLHSFGSLLSGRVQRQGLELTTRWLQPGAAKTQRWWYRPQFAAVQTRIGLRELAQLLGRTLPFDSDFFSAKSADRLQVWNVAYTYPTTGTPPDSAALAPRRFNPIMVQSRCRVLGDKLPFAASRQWLALTEGNVGLRLLRSRIRKQIRDATIDSFSCGHDDDESKPRKCALTPYFTGVVHLERDWSIAPARPQKNRARGDLSEYQRQL